MTDHSYVMGRKMDPAALRPGDRVDYVASDCLHGVHRRHGIFVAVDGDTVHVARGGEVFAVPAGRLVEPITTTRSDEKYKASVW